MHDQADDPRFTPTERAAIAVAVAKMKAGTEASRAARRFEDDAADFRALLEAAARRP